MTLVWERAPYTSGSLLVLLALADWANDEGVSWPAIDRLARKARLERRSTQYIIRQLKADEMIQIDEGGGRGKRHKYFINVQKLRGLPEIKGENDDMETVQFATQRVQSTTETVQPIAPDPLVEPLVDPPREDTSSGNGKGSRLSKDFGLTTEMRDWAKRETPCVNLEGALVEFRDYWIAIPGKAGLKLDWVATWRNRMRVLQERATTGYGRTGNGSNKQNSGQSHSGSNFEHKPKSIIR